MDAWIISTKDICNSEISRLSKLLSIDEAARANSYYHYQDKKNYIVAHALKRKMLSVNLGIKDTANLIFSKDKYGKPKVINYEIEFNISHSSSVVTCVVSNSGECGVDIENYREIKELNLLINKVLTNQEKKTLYKKIGNVNNNFLDKWVMKEAILKKSGQGLSVDLQNICTVKDFEKIDEMRSTISSNHLFQHKSTDYTFAICSQTANDIKIKKLNTIML